MRNRFISTEKRPTEYYKNIQIHADLFLHQQAYDLFSKYVPKGDSIIDIGAGEGAFSQRLYDNEYKVFGTDLNLYEWKASDVPFLKLDINKGLVESVNRVFDSACCLEVIEHLENPWALLRDIRKIVKPGGYLLLSTPNITSFWSRIYFMRTGQFHGFMDYDLDYGHINPISAFEISTIAKNTGWKMLDIQPGGYLPIFDFSEPTKLPLLFSNFFRWIPYILSKNHKNGWALLYLMQNLGDEFKGLEPGNYYRP